MKSLLRNLSIALAVISMGFATACANNDKVIEVKDLPVKAQQFVRKYFKGNKIMIVKEDRDVLGKNYDVIFSNGNNIEFNRNGEWEDINCKATAVPNNIIPNRIRTYVNTNYPGNKVVKIEKDGKDHKVELSNRIELTFDRNFKLIDLDN